MFLQVYFRTLFNLLVTGNFSFSIYTFFWRNWWSCKDLGLFYVVLYKALYEDFLQRPFP